MAFRFVVGLRSSAWSACGLWSQCRLSAVAMEGPLLCSWIPRPVRLRAETGLARSASRGRTRSLSLSLDRGTDDNDDRRKTATEGPPSSRQTPSSTTVADP